MYVGVPWSRYAIPLLWRWYSVIYNFYVLQLLMLHHDWYFVFISYYYHVQIRLLFLSNICSASFLFLFVFTVFNKYNNFQRLLLAVHTQIHMHARIRTHAHTNTICINTYLYTLLHFKWPYGNPWPWKHMCRHQFHDIIMHSFPDIEEISFFSIMAVLIRIHIYAYS